MIFSRIQLIGINVKIAWMRYRVNAMEIDRDDSETDARKNRLDEQITRAKKNLANVELRGEQLREHIAWKGSGVFSH